VSVADHETGGGAVPVAQVPRLALRSEEAACACGVSRDFFDEHVAPELRWVRRGRLKFVPIHELQDWLAKNAARVLEEI